MNDEMPQWRSFSSGVPDPAGAASSVPAEPSRRAGTRWLIPVLVGLIGLAAGMAIIGGVLVVLLAGPAADDSLAAVGDPLSIGTGAPAAIDRADPTVAPELVVDVAGAVVRPGLHRLLLGDRVGDALSAAGGFAPRADLAQASRSLNLAQPLTDGMKVLVPQLGTDRVAAAGAAPGSGDGRIDLNHAGQAELESLPGIGPVTARKIMAARDEQRFEKVNDLRARGLVGESVFEDVRDLIRAG